MRNNLPIRVTLRKIQSEDNIKISLIIKSTLKVVRVSNPRNIKNGVAKFYGETVTLPNAIGSFEFYILDGDTDRCLAQLPVPKQVVGQFTTRKSSFYSQGGGFKLNWQAEYSCENEDKNVDSTDRELKDLQDTPLKDKQIVQPADKIRRRRKQRRNIDTISEPGEPNRHDLEGFSSATRARNLITDFDKLDLAIKDIKKPLFSIEQKELTSRKSSSKSKAKQKPTRSDSKTSHQKNPSLARILSENQLSNKDPTENKTSQQQRKLQRHRSGLLERLGMREVICTGLFGIITGLAAAQF